MYDARATAGVLPREYATSLTTRVTARLRAVFVGGTGLTASPTAASTVAPQVRKSLALTSAPVASLSQALMSGDRTSCQRPPDLNASSSSPPPRRRLSASTVSATAASTTACTRRLPCLAG